MVIKITSRVETIIQVVSPLFGTGAGGAEAAAAGAGAAVTAAGAVDADAVAGADDATEAPTTAGPASGSLAVAEDAAGSAAGTCASTAAPVAIRPSPSTREANRFFISVVLLWRVLEVCRAFALQRFLAGFTRTDAHDLFKVVNKNLAVTDFAGAGGAFDGLDHAVYQFIGHSGLDLDFW